MDRTPLPPEFGSGAFTSTIEPEDAGEFFDSFAAGAHREVLLLGKPVEVLVHYVKGQRYKSLCASRLGVCSLCEVAAATKEGVAVRSRDYFAPAFVRKWKEREFHQRVAIFSKATDESIEKQVAGGSHRGHRVEVKSWRNGSSTKYEAKALEGLPAGFPSMLPPAFAVEPWIRARYGRQQIAGEVLVFLPSFKCEAIASGPASRPEPAKLSAADCAQSPEELDKIRELVAKARGLDDEPRKIPSVRERETIEIASHSENYGERKLVAGLGFATGTHSIGEVLKPKVEEIKARLNGHAPLNGSSKRKGGAA